MEDDQLSELVAKVAKEELNEDEHNRRQSLEQFRDWILKNPDIKDCRTDDVFLLSFLRCKKFNVPMAQQCLMNGIRFMQTIREVVTDFGALDDCVEDVFDSGYNYASPVRDKQGRLVMFSSTQNFDCKKYDWKTLIKAEHVNLRTLIEDEICQVVGVVFVIDMEKCLELYNLYPINYMYYIITMFEKSLPLRTKHVYFFNCPSAAVWIFNLIKSQQSEKMKRRLTVLSSIEELQQHVDKKVLPKELGGLIPASEMIEQWKKVVLSHRESLASLKSVRLVGDIGHIGDLQGSFKTLNID